MKDHSEKVMSEINVTPFVDVMLVLLIIFMITAPMIQHGISVNLPKASTKQMHIGEKELVLTITREKKILIGTAPIEISKLRSKLKAIFESRENRDIYLKADEEIPYGFVV
ncbi:MAG: biopolymer transporter ExbD, partial [Thermodesulfobacteriota bacterium]|nr:biopolymer transporter ExbD [Thermodesulfobacteriota bacterium]